MSSLYSTRSAGPISLLYVEDDAINQEVLRTMLANVSDITLHIATDDTEAFELLGTLSTVPDVVLMDHHLGHITGVEVRRRSCLDSNNDATDSRTDSNTVARIRHVRGGRSHRATASWCSPHEGRPASLSRRPAGHGQYACQVW